MQYELFLILSQVSLLVLSLAKITDFHKVMSSLCNLRLHEAKSVDLLCASYIKQTVLCSWSLRKAKYSILLKERVQNREF